MNATTSIFIGLFAWVDKIIYGGIGLVYELLLSLVDMGDKIFTADVIKEFSTRIYALLGIFMLFKLTFSLITYILNPDEFSDKNKGMAALGKNIIISLLLIILVPYIFAEANKLQKIILEENTIPNLVFGTNSTSSPVDDAGDKIQFMLLSQFLRPNVEDIDELNNCTVLYEVEDGNFVRTEMENGEKSNYNYEVNDDCFTPLEGMFEDKEAFNNYKNAFITQNSKLLLKTNIVTARDNNNKGDNYLINYQVPLSTVAGAVVFFILVTFCMDIALRTIKLAFYQIIAPIPIISYCDPKSGKDGMFKKWVKASVNAYLSLFMRLLALYFAIYIITRVSDFVDFANHIWMTAFMIIGALMFAKALPNIISDITGIKFDSKGFTLNPFKKIENEALGGKALTGGLGGMIAGVAGNRGASRLTEGVAGTLRGAFANKGYSGGMNKQAEANRKMREARIQGAGVFGSKVAALSSRYGADNMDLEKTATNLRKDKRAVELVRRDVDARVKEQEVAKKAVEQKIAPKETVIDKQKKVADSAKNMESLASGYITKGKAGAVSNHYKKLQGQADYVKQLKVGDVLAQDIVDGNNNVIFFGGHDRVSTEMMGIITNLPDRYANKEGKKALVDEMMAGRNTGAKTANVSNDDMNEFRAAFNSYSADVAICNDVINDYNTHNINPADNINPENTCTSYDDVHSQIGNVQNTISAEADSIKSDKATIENISRKIKDLVNEATVEISGETNPVRVEEAENTIKVRESTLKDTQEQRKLDREQAKNSSFFS